MNYSRVERQMDWLMRTGQWIGPSIKRTRSECDDQLLAPEIDADGFVSVDWRRAGELYAQHNEGYDEFHYGEWKQSVHRDQFGLGSKGKLYGSHIPIPDVVYSAGFVVRKRKRDEPK